MLDRKLLVLLQEDGRISITDLSKAMNLSRTSISERLARLLSDGVIEGFSARISPHKLGLGVSFIMDISELKVPTEQIVKRLKDNPYVTEIHCVTGKTNYIAKASMPSVEDMNAFLSELMPYCSVASAIILHSPLSHKTL